MNNYFSGDVTIVTIVTIITIASAMTNIVHRNQGLMLRNVSESNAEKLR